MKISHSVRALYDTHSSLAKLLEARVKEIFETKKRKQWFYTGRVKTLESFAQKLETGRVTTPSEMEDLFACTLVVENRKSISDALSLISSEFRTLEQRPKSFDKTHKSPESFPFDDLRLYAKLKIDESLPETPIQDLKFEIQIKTFLQHAWGIATHDLIYKGESIDWAKARVAFQIKAMLEHAEISVEQVESLASSTGLAMTDHRTQEKKEILEWLTSTWPRDALPKDLVRLADTILDLCSAIRIRGKDAISAVNEATDIGQGANLTDLSPYSIVLRSLLNKYNTKFMTYLKSPFEARERKVRIFGTDDPALKELLATCNSEKYIYVDLQHDSKTE